MAGSRSSASIQLVVFDSRRGNVEGKEADKLIAFSPVATPINEQSTLAGLFQGLIAFNSNFTRNDSWDVTETNQEIWSLFQAEPHIYYGLTASKRWLPRHVTLDNLKALLHHMYNLTRLLHGTIQSLLNQDESGSVARALIQPILNITALHLTSSSSTWLSKELRNPLSTLDMMPTLKLQIPLSIAVQSFCSTVQSIPTVTHVVSLYQNQVLWSSLQPADSASLYSLIATTFLPGGPPLSKLHEKDPCCDIMYSNSWEQLEDGFLVLKGGQTQEIRSIRLPLVHFSDSSSGLLVPHTDGKFLTVLVLAVANNATSQVSRETLETVKATLGSALDTLVAQFADQLGPEPGHIIGHRYLVQDAELGSLKASPRDKISGMTHHGRAVASSVRDSMTRANTEKIEIWVKSSQDNSILAVKDDERMALTVRDPKKSLIENIETSTAFIDQLLLS